MTRNVWSLAHSAVACACRSPPPPETCMETWPSANDLYKRRRVTCMLGLLSRVTRQSLSDKMTTALSCVRLPACAAMPRLPAGLGFGSDTATFCLGGGCLAPAARTSCAPRPDGALPKLGSLRAGCAAGWAAGGAAGGAAGVQVHGHPSASRCE